MSLGPATRGILAMLAAIGLFSTMDAIIKSIHDHVGTVQILFFRSLFALLPLLPVIRAEGGAAALRTRRPWAQLAYGLLMMGFLLCFFTALGLLPLADVYAVNFASPLFITALSLPLLGEPVGPRRWAAVLVGFAGVLVILRPGAGVLTLGGLVALAAAAFYALGMIQVRRLARTETSGSIVFWFCVIGTAASALLLPFLWRAPRPLDWPLLAAVGILGGLGQVLVTHAYRLAPAALVSPFQYTSMLWGLAYGAVLFGDRPDAMTLLGSAVVIGSGIYLLQREARRRRAVPGESAP